MGKRHHTMYVKENLYIKYLFLYSSKPTWVKINTKKKKGQLYISYVKQVLSYACATWAT